ncbi:MAG: T9SS type A sorting domain-containing protein [Gracilimonas sp.]
MRGHVHQFMNIIWYKFKFLSLGILGAILCLNGTTVLAQNNDQFTDIDADLTGVISSSSAWGDYDGDGDLDLVISGYDPHDDKAITIIYQNNDETFMDSGAEILGLNLGDIDWGDYNGDGHLDLALIGDDGSDTEFAAIYQNNGDGTFTDIEAGLLGVDVGSADWGDYDGDGDLDLLVTGADSSYQRMTIIYENDNGTFSDAEAGLTDVDDSGSDWGDYDDDGDLDLVIAGNESAFDPIAIVYQNNGDGTFTDIEAELTGIEEASCNWGDYDGDGDPDLVLAGVNESDEKTATIYRNDNGEFIDVEADLNGVEQASSQWGDYDGDGDLDLVITGENVDGDPSATIYQNDEGTFSALDEEIIGVERGSASWGDYNGDGYLDLVITGESQAFIYQNMGETSTSIETDKKATPTEFALKQNYPNPFNPTTTIQFSIPEVSEVTLEVFDLLGRNVVTLIDRETKSTGNYSLQFNARNLNSGMYIYRLQAGNTVITKKLTLIK